MSRAVHRGGCACGTVRFEARGEPWRTGLCHCLTCRKAHGSPLNAFAVFPVEAVTITGRTGVFRSSEHGRRFFCRGCGGPAYFQDEGGDEIGIGLGSFDEPDLFRPTYEGFVGRRESWLGDLPTLTRHYEGNRPKGGRSEG